MQEELWVKQETDFDGMWKVLTAFADTFPKTLKVEDKRKQYTEKILTYGFMITVYFEERPLGFFTGYANDHVTKRAYASLYAIAEQIGLLRGIVYKMLGNAVREYVESQGMKSIYGEVYDDNLKARKLYEQIGMKYVGRASEHSSYIMLNADFEEKRK